MELELDWHSFLKNRGFKISIFINLLFKKVRGFLYSKKKFNLYLDRHLSSEGLRPDSESGRFVNKLIFFKLHLR